MSEKEAPEWRESDAGAAWRQSKGETSGMPWRIRYLRIGTLEVSLGDGFGDGVRAGVTFHAPNMDRGLHHSEAEAMRAAARMLRDISAHADTLADQLACEVGA